MPFESPCNSLNSGQFSCAPYKTLPGEILAPWVQALFKVSGVAITVGNQSSPDNNNRAVIKDFEFGHSNGLECKIRIVDEQGGEFVKFMEDMLKNFKCTIPELGYEMQVDFGWIREGCSSPYPLVKNINPYVMLMMDIENNFVGGKFVYDIVGQDIGVAMFKANVDKGYPGHLTEAITAMLKDDNYPPSVSSVKFQKMDGTPITFKEYDGKGNSTKGPYKDQWLPNTMDKINAAMDWLKTWMTSDKKQIFPTYNSEVSGGEIIFWEDPSPTCNQSSIPYMQNCLGTYIVNSGQDTGVIDFSYKANWNFYSLANAGGAMGENQVLPNQDGGKQQGIIDCNTLNRASIPTAGQKVSTNATDLAKDKLGPSSVEETSNSQALQLKAFAHFNLFAKAITANLTIMGDPTIMRPSEGLVARFVTIIFLNPYYLLSNGTACGDWLSGSFCNSVLSNRGWLVQSISHRIADGKFTTTLGLHLPAPGIDIDVGQPLGGVGSGGWTPPTSC